MNDHGPYVLREGGRGRVSLLRYTPSCATSVASRCTWRLCSRVEKATMTYSWGYEGGEGQHVCCGGKDDEEGNGVMRTRGMDGSGAGD